MLLMGLVMHGNNISAACPLASAMAAPQSGRMRAASLAAFASMAASRWASSSRPWSIDFMASLMYTNLYNKNNPYVPL
jgi:hypothetical protein